MVRIYIFVLSISKFIDLYIFLTVTQNDISISKFATNDKPYKINMEMKINYLRPMAFCMKLKPLNVCLASYDEVQGTGAQLSNDEDEQYW